MKTSEIRRLKQKYNEMPFVFRLVTSFYEFLILKSEDDSTDTLMPPKTYPPK